MKIVCDTNVILSAIIFKGNPGRILDSRLTKKIEVCVSKEILKEVSDKLRKKFRWEEEKIFRTIYNLRRSCLLVQPKTKISVIKTDISDNIILECAVEGKANYIVSGDTKHLLPIRKFQGISIMSPQEFLKRVLYN